MAIHKNSKIVFIREINVGKSLEIVFYNRTGRNLLFVIRNGNFHQNRSFVIIVYNTKSLNYEETRRGENC